MYTAQLLAHNDRLVSDDKPVATFMYHARNGKDAMRIARAGFEHVMKNLEHDREFGPYYTFEIVLKK
jgi:hypothetical protein